MGSIEIAPTPRMTRALEPGHADVGALLGAMAAAHPAWRGSGAGWNVDPAATFVVIYDAWAPVAGGALLDAGGAAARASQLCVVPERRGEGLGATLLDTLEALARDRGSARLRLDCTAFLLGDDELPHARCGYAIGRRTPATRTSRCGPRRSSDRSQASSEAGRPDRSIAEPVARATVLPSALTTSASAIVIVRPA